MSTIKPNANRTKKESQLVISMSQWRIVSDNCGVGDGGRKKGGPGLRLFLCICT